MPSASMPRTTTSIRRSGASWRKRCCATAAPAWLRGVVPEPWYKRHARRVEDGRLPRTEAEREAYARTVGEDGFALLDRLDGP